MPFPYACKVAGSAFYISSAADLQSDRNCSSVAKWFIKIHKVESFRANMQACAYDELLMLAQSLLL